MNIENVEKLMREKEKTGLEKRLYYILELKENDRRNRIREPV
jgi:hypothetical protein